MGLWGIAGTELLIQLETEIVCYNKHWMTMRRNEIEQRVRPPSFVSARASTSSKSGSAVEVEVEVESSDSGSFSSESSSESSNSGPI